MNKLQTARLLMAISILLILVFQAYWLNKVFEEGKSSFNKTTDLTFKETLYRLQAARFTGDTMFFKSIPGGNVFMSDMVQAVHKVGVYRGDTTKKFIISTTMNATSSVKNVDSSLKNERLIIRSKKDNLPVIEKLLRENRTLGDTIPLKSIDSLYNILLAREGIHVNYRLLVSDSPVNDSVETYSTRKVAVGLVDPVFYRAVFTDPTWHVFRDIAMQVLLSLFLVTLITLSFIFLYRNLIAQQKLTAIKNEFIGNITHELKTPIATVSVAIEAMKSFNALQDPVKAKEYLDIAGQELGRLSMLVDKVLRLSMFENRQLELKVGKLDFLQLVKDVIKSMQLQFEKSNATVQVSSSGDDFSIQADQLHIASVIYNLLDNAIKYSTDPLIEVTATATGSHVLLSVKDNGIGIDPLYKDKIFDKFFRVPHGHQHNVKGYGLGLSYAAHIISQHKGIIAADSDGKNGTTFTFKLPKTNAG